MVELGARNTGSYELEDVVASPGDVDRERAARLAAWDLLCGDPDYPNLKAQTVRVLDVYGGAQGVWLDKARTAALAPSGVAVGLRHPGRRYESRSTARETHAPSNAAQAVRARLTSQLPTASLVIDTAGCESDPCAATSRALASR